MIATTDEGEKMFVSLYCFKTFWSLFVLLLVSFLNFAPCSLTGAACAIGLGGHGAQGPGRHQGAAAALISPTPATTFSGHNLGQRRKQEQESLEREQAGGWWAGGRGEAKKTGRGAEGGGRFDRRSLHLTAAPSVRAPCSHRQATTQGRFLLLHTNWWQKSVQRCSHLHDTLSPVLTLLTLFPKSLISHRRSHGTAEPAHVWSDTQTWLSQTHVGSFSSCCRQISHLWSQSLLAYSTVA